MRGLDPFMGRSERLNLKALDGRTDLRKVGGRDVPVPERSFLLLMKLKAAWDRAWRLDNNQSPDPQ
jgi:hypothetical protein